MKLADYIARFLKDKGIGRVFAVSGGASLHLIDAVCNTDGINFTCPLHEQSAAMAADGYSRSSGKIGAAMSTSGPGATNLLTGIACAYYDSIPTLFISGQVSTYRLKGDLKVRQIGFQETDIVSMVRPISKYAVLVSDPTRIRYELEKAFHLATTGRQGPCLIDIPDDLQRYEIDPDVLPAFTPPVITRQCANSDFDLDRLTQLMETSERPVFVIGAGVRLAHAQDEIKRLVDRLGIPFAPTWGAADLMSADHPFNVGTFGTHGTRHGNFAVQNADLVISIGCRLDTKATGSPPSTFARAAKIVMVDIDRSELEKFSDVTLEMKIECDAGDFIRDLWAADLPSFERNDWIDKISDWKARYPSGPSVESTDRLCPYHFSRRLEDFLVSDEHIYLDTGCLLPWILQAFRVKAEQRLFHDWNNTAMGWAIPASIGGLYANPNKRTLCLTGDGSLMMNVQELATIAHNNLPIKIILYNNHGYSMIRQTQDQWFKSDYFASSAPGGLPDPDYAAMAAAHNIPSFTISLNEEIETIMPKFLEIQGPALCILDIDPNIRVEPQVKFGHPNEDPYPLLPRDVLEREMLIPTIDIQTPSRDNDN